MINSKSDLYNYINADVEARLNGNKDSFLQRVSKYRRFLFFLRKCEYYYNYKKGVIGKAGYLFYKFRYRRIGEKCGWDIPINVLGPGACIVHKGTVVINGNCKIGSNCRIHVCVNIGANKDRKEAPVIGNNVYIGPGAKIFGGITIADNISIGANAVVNKSFTQAGITIAGVPAIVIIKLDQC